MQVIGIERKVFCVVFVFSALFIVGCHQYTPEEEELASKIEKRLLEAEKGTLVVFKRQGTVKIIRSPNLVKAGTFGAPSVSIDEHPASASPPYPRILIKLLKNELQKVVYRDDPEYKGYAEKFILQQVGIYETDD